MFIIEAEKYEVEKNTVISRPAARSQQSLNLSLTTLQLRQKDLIDNAFTRFFYGCNIGFEVVQSDYCRELIKFLCPAYLSPTTEEFASTFLDKD